MQGSSSNPPRPSGLRGRVAAALLAAGARFPPDRDAALDRAAPALVFAPHPDDEVLGCGGTIALKVLAGASLRVVIMTDGRTSHAAFVDTRTLIDMRRAEAIDASTRLGLNPDAYLFLDFEDGRLRENAERARQRVVELLRRYEPKQVFVPHRHDRLSDHVATFEIVTGAVREYGKPVTVLEYPVWLWNTWPWTSNLPRRRSRLAEMPRLLRAGAALAFGCRTRVDIGPVLARKADALAQYRSQMERQRNDPRWPILSDVSNGLFLERFQAPTEVFRRTELGVK